jgi:RNA polymerase sigma-70 factor (ECF subfamily)
VVLQAARGDEAAAAAALETLCRTYWYPLYCYVRRRGHAPCDAQDLTQEFFARMLAQDWVARADREKGRFRSFLLMAMSRFLANEWDRARTLKRGGSHPHQPLVPDTAETRYAQEPATRTTPEDAFEKQWALTLLDQVLEQLQQEYQVADQHALFAALKPTLAGSRETLPYAELGPRLGLSEGAIKVAVSRLRQRYRERLRAEIAQTVAGPEEVEEELRHLVRVLARG